VSVYRRLLPAISLLLQPNPPTAAIAVTLLWQFAEGSHTHTHTHTHTRLTTLCPGLPRWASTRTVKPVWILLEQETVSGSGISWTTCKSAPCSRQITMLAPHHSVFYRPDALPAAQPTVSKHWRELTLLRNISAFCRGVRNRNSESTVVGDHSSVA